VAPTFAPAALAILHQKKNLRLLELGTMLPANEPGVAFKSVSGGMVLQQRDDTATNEVENGKVVTDKGLTDAQRRALSFAWKVCKHVKSNAIVMAREEDDGTLRTVGVGAGQMSRVVSVEICAKKAGDLAKGTVLASDAFFPFPDGVEAAAAAGAIAIAQPGGSVKDADVIAAANKLGVAMLFTGFRHFRH
jgi:phosphoribosylaminoimidazolecarboxamide formyltransferase/IMP cyclohydrolase